MNNIIYIFKINTRNFQVDYEWVPVYIYLHKILQHFENIISEKKLKKVKGKSNTEPTSKDIINSLKQCKEASMKRFLESDPSKDTDHCADYRGAVVNKAHQGQQQTVEEIVALVYQDQLASQGTEPAEQSSKQITTDSDPSLHQRWTLNMWIFTELRLVQYLIGKVSCG